jgi:U3 small nucleolar RNA-associated protein 13
MQLLSGSADGLIRLWTIRSGECEKILDAHTDKVWALSLSPQSILNLAPSNSSADTSIATATATTTAAANDVEQQSGDAGVAASAVCDADSEEKLSFFSGGSDSRLNMWVDVTAEEEETRMQALEKELLLEQELQNDVRHKRYDKALSIAMRIGHSNRVLSILQSIMEDDDNIKGTGDAKDNFVAVFPALTNPLAAGSSSGASKQSIAERLDAYVRKWSDEEIEKIFGLMKDWNTNAKNSYVCTILLNSLLRVVGVHKLSALKAVAAALPGLIAYSERHYARASKLVQSCYVVDYFSSIMNWIPEASEEEGDNEQKAGGDDSSNGAAQKKRGRTATATDKKPVLFGSKPANGSATAGGADDEDDEDAEHAEKKAKKAKKSKRTAA